MEIKDGVNLWGLEPEMRLVLAIADSMWRERGQTLVVTSARDGVHSAGSVHYYGYAVDLRTKCFTRQDGSPDHNRAQALADELHAELEKARPGKYRALYEAGRPGHEHIHVHYRPAYTR